jgi:GT2 family glycosyltransferase
VKLISIVIVTYNRPHEIYELLESINKLENANNYLSDIIVFENGSTVDYTKVKNYAEQLKLKLPLVYFESNENLGVSKGKNAACKLASGQYLLILDDDTILPYHNTLSLINDIINEEKNISKSQRPIGIINLKVNYFDTNEMQQTAFPNKQFEKYKNQKQLLINYYVGAAHIIKATVLKEVGYLPEDFFYGMEEYDLSYRTINGGYCMLYDNRIMVLHKESPLGRKPRPEVLKMMWINKAKVAYRYLPIFYFFSVSLLWSFFILKKSKCNFKAFFSGWLSIFKIPMYEKRKSISKDSLKYIKETGGRLLY